MNSNLKWFSGILIVGTTCFQIAFAETGRTSVTDKEIIERLTRIEEKIIRIEEGQKALNQRIDDMNQRINDVNTNLGKRIDDTNKRIDDLQGLMWVVLAGMFALFGFVVWDRKTALSPVIRKTRELEESDVLVLRILKEYARQEPKLAEILKSLGILS